MVYTRIKNTTFKASEYFNEKSKNKYQSTFYLKGYKPAKLDKKSESKNLKISSINKENLCYKDFEIINKIHIEYLNKLKGKMHPDNFLQVLYNSELTGAEVFIRMKEKEIEGFIVEERANVIYVISQDNRVRMFIKRMNVFYIKHEDIEYKFIGNEMTKKRFLKK